MQVDVAALKQRVDVLLLIGSDTPLRKVAGTGGGEWAGPCPWCGGRDRFRVQPRLGYWWCRQCSGDRWQDAIDYVVRRDGVSFVEACQRLGASPSELGAGPGRRVRAKRIAEGLGLRRASEVQLAEDLEPTPRWQAAALAFVERCEARLWPLVGARARAYLQQRGLREATLRAWRVGFQPAYGLHHPAETWDLAGERVHLPRGIVLPWFGAGQLWQVKVRLSGGDPDRRYLAIRGGHPWLFGVDTLVAGRPAALLEGELDTLLVAQEAGDLVATASLGACRKLPGPRALARLSAGTPLLGIYDADAEGQAGLARLGGLLPALIPSRPPQGKDATCFWQEGGQIRPWILAQVRQEEPSAARTDVLLSSSAGGVEATLGSGNVQFCTLTGLRG